MSLLRRCFHIAFGAFYAFGDDDGWALASHIALSALLALFPFLIFLTSVIGVMLGSETSTRQTLFDYLARVMPQSAFQLISTTMTEVSSASGGGKISFGILAALWAASNGMTAITGSLNTAYDVEETRPWWKQRLVAIGLTMAVALLLKEFKLLSFDPAFGEGIGLPMHALDRVLMLMVVVSVAIGLQAVGVVLMSALLITPAAAARRSRG